jgi:hypothetical protein
MEVTPDSPAPQSRRTSEGTAERSQEGIEPCRDPAAPRGYLKSDNGIRGKFSANSWQFCKMRKGLAVARLGRYWRLETKLPAGGVNKATKFCAESEQCFKPASAVSARNEGAEKQTRSKDMNRRLPECKKSEHSVRRNAPEEFGGA